MSESNLEYSYNTNITCPYCDCEDKDSWEQNEYLRDGEIEIECYECGETFYCEMNVSVTYTTNKKEQGDARAIC